MAEEQTQRDDGGGVATAEDTLSVTDNRTGESYEVEVEDGTVKAMDFRQIKVSEDDFGLMTYDPAFTNTASVRSSVCFIDGEAGVLEYRGYPIDQLCERSSYLEVAYLLIYGELPTQEQLDEWVFEITHHTFVHENIKKFVEGFRYDAHPMGMLLATVGALSTFYPDAKKIDDEIERHMAAVRLIAKVPTLAAFAYRHNLGLPYVYPDNDLSYPGNFLSMMYKMTEVKYEPDPRLERKLDIATELEKRALDDDFFHERKLYPNVDFYSGLIYEALGLPTDMFTVMFAIPRTSGWVAQWREMLDDEETKIARPRQIYTGERERDYEPVDDREQRVETPSGKAQTNTINPAA